ncbi:MAG: antibiotic biosynthesis monooxygenase family protein [Paracoccaceae bacterium]
MSNFAPLLELPYYAVIFTAQLSDQTQGYDNMATQMADQAAQQPGYLGIESTRNDAGLGITVSYWADENAIKAWKEITEHLLAQKMGRARWYSHYTLRVAKVERHYEGPQGRGK